MGVRGVSSEHVEHMESMEMFSCSPTVKNSSFFFQTLLFTAFLVTVLKNLTYALVSTWSLVSSGCEHVKRKMHPWYYSTSWFVTFLFSKFAIWHLDPGPVVLLHSRCTPLILHIFSRQLDCNIFPSYILNANRIQMYLVNTKIKRYWPKKFLVKRSVRWSEHICSQTWPRVKCVKV